MPNYSGEPGLFLPTTEVFTINTENKQELSNLLTQLRKTVNNICLAVNKKDTGIYDQREFVCGQVYFANTALTSLTSKTPELRQVWRRVYKLPVVLPNNTTTTLAHNLTITNNFTFTRFYGCSTDKVAHTWIPLPYISVPGNMVSIWGDNVNINIQTNFNATAYNNTYIVVEYLKS
jgi:hypothetical protein